MHNGTDHWKKEQRESMASKNKSKKKLLVATGGGDCPGLNAVIRGIVKAAKRTGEWDVYGSIEAFNGVIKNPPEIIKLNKRVGGIHIKGGTIIKTTNRGNPFSFPIKGENGKTKKKDISGDLVKKIQDLGFEAMINIGGDGSQKISQKLYEKGLNIIGVPKTIDNDLSATDLTFGFTTAVQIATDSFDKLVTTAESHHRVIIMEVMGRDAGWIALHTAIAGGAEICLIPEIPYRLDKVLKRIKKRYNKGKGFVNIVIAAQVRTTILGHTQRGGTPVAFDRILASSMGVKAFKMVRNKEYGKMVAFKNNAISTVTLKEATQKYNHVDKNHYLIDTARALGISFGD